MAQRGRLSVFVALRTAMLAVGLSHVACYRMVTPSEEAEASHETPVSGEMETSAVSMDLGDTASAPQPAGDYAFRWLVLSEYTGDGTSSGLAYRVSVSGIIGDPVRIPDVQSQRWTSFSKDGRFLSHGTFGGPALVTSFREDPPGTAIQIAPQSGEMFWSPAMPILLVQHNYDDPTVSVFDARAEEPEIRSLAFDRAPTFVNPSPNWAPNGNRVAFQASFTVAFVDFSLDSPSPVYVPEEGIDWQVFTCEWSPDSRYLACFADTDENIETVRVIDFSVTPPTIHELLGPTGDDYHYLSWISPKWLIVRVNLDGRAGEKRSVAVRVSENGAMGTIDLPYTVAESSRDAVIAYEGVCATGGVSGLCIMSFETDPPGIVAQYPGLSSAQWSAGGRHLTFLNPDAPSEWWIIADAVRNGEAGKITDQPRSGVTGEPWSPDDQWCLYVTGFDEEEVLFGYHVETRESHTLTSGNIKAVGWTEDSRYFYVAKADEPGLVIYRQSDAKIEEHARIDAEILDRRLWQPVLMVL